MNLPVSLKMLSMALAYAPYLLEKKAKEIKASMDLENGSIKQVRTVYEGQTSRQ